MASQPNTTNSESDRQLLSRFIEDQDESAFEALVERYVNLVFGAAVRRTADHGCAEEIAQTVFTLLARKAGRLNPRPTIAGWLMRATTYEASRARRKIANRQKTMTAYQRETSSSKGQGTVSDTVWEQALPHLDQAISALSDPDREVVIMRFYRRLSFKEIGSAIGKSDHAAQKQASRAVDKLRRLLSRRGAVVSGATLTSGLLGVMTQRAPASLTQSLSQTALAGASSIAASTLTFHTLLLMTTSKLNIAIVAIAIAALVGGTGGYVKGRSDAALSNHATQLLRSRIAESVAARGSVSPEATLVVASEGRDRSVAEILQKAAEMLRSEDTAVHRKALLEFDQIDPFRDIPEALSFLETVRGENGVFSEIAKQVVRLWAMSDGPAAMEYSLNNLSDEPLRLACIDVMHVWAESDPGTAWEWYRAAFLDESLDWLPLEDLVRLSQVTFRGLAMSDPTTASRVFGQLPGEFMDPVTHGLAKMAALDNGRDRALQVVAAIEVPEAKFHAITSIAEHWGRMGPEEAAHWLENVAFENREQFIESALALADSWENRDPGATVSWLWNQVPEMREMISSEMIPAWEEVNPEAVRAWRKSVQPQVEGAKQ